MSNGTNGTRGRVSKRAFISRVARRAGVPVRVASAIYDAAINELIEIVEGGESLTLTNFGRFYLQEHKGHRVRFADESGLAAIGNYAVLKFSATRQVNLRVGNKDHVVEMADVDEDENVGDDGVSCEERAS